jgi:Family of unknown function (DUF5719)
MRARGQGFLTILLIAVILVGGVAFDRLGVRAPGPASAGEAPSASWLCPHGGGPDWQAQLFLANPGTEEVIARITSMDSEGSAAPQMVTVPPGGEVRMEPTAEERGAATFVETFGGWVAAGWVVHGASGEVGVGAEPCAPAAGRSWYSAGISAGQDERGFLVVMNPFGVDAVFDVALFVAPPRNPIRDSDLTDVTLRPGRSIAIDVGAYAEGEEALGVDLEVSTGRVAASTTVVSSRSGITSVLGTPSTSASWLLPTMGGAGQSILSIEVPGEQGSDVQVAALAERGVRPLGGLSAKSLDPASAAIFPAVTDGPTGVRVSVQDGAPVVAALRTTGRGNDSGATGGAAAPGDDWVVMPTVAGEPSTPGLAIVNPGDHAASVTLQLLARQGGPSDEITIEVPAASAVAAPRGFLAKAPDAAVLVHSDGSPVVALGASSSLGNSGLSTFGMAVGVPMPT